jgi:CRP-like cAMP-binding protein
MAITDQELQQLARLLVPINGLPAQYQDQVLKEAEVLDFRKRERIFQQGSRDNHGYYLLEGTIELFADDQLIKQVEGGTGQAFHPLAQLQPRQMTAIAKTPVRALRINRVLLDKLLSVGSKASAVAGIEATEIEVGDLGVDADWLASILQSELFARIPPSNIDRLLATMETVSFKAGDVVVRQGDPGDYYYIVKQGRCEVVRRTGTGNNEIKLAELNSGVSFGEEALVNESRRNATVRMLTDGEMVRLTKNDFTDLIKKPLLKSIAFAEAEKRVAGGAVWLDVRFPEEHRAGAIEGSRNIPLGTLRLQTDKLEPDIVYVAYCDSGSRSSVAAFLLCQKGFDAYYLRDGCVPYIDPVATPASMSGKSAEAKAPMPPTADPTDADIRASVLKTELAKANLQIEEARRFKAEAEAAKVAAQKAREEKLRLEQAATKEARRIKAEAEAARIAAQKAIEEKQRLEQTATEEARRIRAEAEAAKAAARKAIEEKQRLEQAATEEATRAKAAAETARQAAEEQLRLEREKLDLEAQKAASMLAEAKRLKSEIESQKRAAEEEAERHREAQEQVLRKLQVEAEQRLLAERAKLDDLYRRKAEELEELEVMKSAAEAELAAERERLEAESSATRRTLDEARQRMLEQNVNEQKMREAAHAQILEERRRLESEFARNASLLETAQREKIAAEAARRAAAEEAESIIAEYKARHEKMRAEEEARLREERQALERERSRLAAAIEDANQSREQAQSLLRQAEDQAAKLRTRQLDGAQPVTGMAAFKLRAEIEAMEAEVAEAARRVREATQAQDDLRERQVSTDQMLKDASDKQDQLRKQLENELDEWIAEQERKQSSTGGREIRAHLDAQTERITSKATQARQQARSHDDALLEELAAIMNSP